MKRLVLLLTVICSFFLILGSANATAPLTQARYVTFSNVTAHSMTVGWTNGNGSRRVVVMKDNDNTWTHIPGTTVTNTTYTQVSGTVDYSAADTSVAVNYLGAGFTDGGKIIYSGSGSTHSVNVTGLTDDHTYYVMVIEYNVVGTGKDFCAITNAQSNPRPKKTLTSVLDPTILGTLVQGANVNLSWSDNNRSDLTEYTLSVYNVGIDGIAGTADDYVETGYDNLDLGTLYNNFAEHYYVNLPQGTYYYKVRATLGGVNGNWVTSNTFSVTDAIPPQFDQTITAMNDNMMTVNINFNESVSSNSASAADLDKLDFNVNFAKNSGTATNAVIASLSKTDDSHYVATLDITGRASGAETIVISPADNTSIFDLAGNAMDADNSDLINQTSHAINLDTTTVSINNSTTGKSYATVHQAINAAVDGNIILLTDGHNYTENFAFNNAKGLTITDDGSATNAKITGNIYYNSTINPYTINSIDIDGHVLLSGSAAQTIQNCNFSYTSIEGDGYNNSSIYPTETFDASAADLTITGCTFDLTNLSYGINLLQTTDNFLALTNVNIDGNTFNNIGENTNAIAFEANYKVSPYPAINIGTTTANIFKGSTNVLNAGGNGIFISGNADASFTHKAASINIQKNNFSGLFPANGKSDIAFDTGKDLTLLCPVIDLGTSGASTNNTFGSNPVTNAYVYSGVDIATSQYLFPGIAVYSVDNTLDNADQAYNTVNAAIGASAQAAGNTVFLGEGTYTDAIAVNKSVTINGKGTSNSGVNTTINSQVTVANTNATGTSINNCYFYADNTNPCITINSANNFSINNIAAYTVSGGKVISADGSSTINGMTISNSTFGARDGHIEDFTSLIYLVGQLTGFIGITGNTFAAETTAVDTTYNIFISSTNGVGVNGGSLVINGNTFNSYGDAITFSNGMVESQANNMSSVSTSIYDNTFVNSRYAVKLMENTDDPTVSFINTMPNSIALFNGATINSGAHFGNTYIYGASWYSLTNIDGTGVLYPSIDHAQAQATADLHTLYVGTGSTLR